MQVSIFATCTTVIGVIMTAFAWTVVNWFWVRPKRVERMLRRQGLNGNPYRVGYGDLKESSEMIKEAISKPISLSDHTSYRLLPFVIYNFNKYGKNCFTWDGPIPRVIISKPEHIKEILLKYGDFPKPKQNPFLNYLLGGVAGLEGTKWATRRKIINPAFHLDKLKGMVPAFQLSAGDMLNKWESLFSDDQESHELDVWPHFQSMTADVLSRTAFGTSYDDGRKIFLLLTELSQLVFKAFLVGYIPGWRFVPTKLNKRLKLIDTEIQDLLKEMIHERENAMKSGEAPNNDLLSILMDSNVKELKEQGNNKNVGMSIKDVIAECKLFYFAGQETTSVLLTWTMVMLSHHPIWQERARKEVLEVFGNDKPGFDGLMHLKVVSMILNEVLRLFPPISFLSRTVQNATQIGKMYLPAGIMVFIPSVLIHCDTELWGDDAKEFKPERFSAGVSEATKGKVPFFPFGGGPRYCVGQNFAMMEAKLALALILQRVTFHLSPTYTHAPIRFITVQPQHGVQLILHKR